MTASPNLPSIESLRRLSSEFLAASVCQLFPRAKILRTGVTQLSFYCEISCDQPIDSQLLPDLEQVMKTVMKQHPVIETLEMMRENAVTFLEHLGQPHLAIQIAESPSNVVQLIRIGKFHNLFTHLDLLDASKIGFVKLFEIEKREEYIRIIGICSSTKEGLKEQIQSIKRAKSRDHRIFGEKLHLFAPLDQKEEKWIWYPNGEILKKELVRVYSDLHLRDNFQAVATPNYPVNHQIFYQGKIPLKLFEIHPSLSQNQGDLECDGGLFSSSIQYFDTATQLVSDEQLQDALNSSLQFIRKTVKMFEFKCRWILFLNGRKLGCRLEELLHNGGISLDQVVKDSSLANPKVEAHLIDSLGREWRGPEVVLSCLDKTGEGSNHSTWVLSHVLYGSLERFIAILVEHLSGKFPVWLAPEQMRVLPIKESFADEAIELQNRLKMSGFRVGIDPSGAQLGARIAAAFEEQVPYSLIIGDKETRNGYLSLRSLEDPSGQRVEQLTFDELSEKLRSEIDQN